MPDGNLALEIGDCEAVLILTPKEGRKLAARILSTLGAREDSRETERAADTDASEVTVYIDRSAFRVSRRAMTGRTLRELATPTIGRDYDLFRVLPGRDDLLVRDEEVIALDEGTEFFSAPKMIAAGALAPATDRPTRSGHSLEGTAVNGPIPVGQEATSE